MPSISKDGIFSYSPSELAACFATPANLDEALANDPMLLFYKLTSSPLTAMSTTSESIGCFVDKCLELDPSLKKPNANSPKVNVIELNVLDENNETAEAAKIDLEKFFGIIRTFYAELPEKMRNQFTAVMGSTIDSRRGNVEAFMSQLKLNEQVPITLKLDDQKKDDYSYFMRALLYHITKETFYCAGYSNFAQRETHPLRPRTIDTLVLLGFQNISSRIFALKAMGILFDALLVYSPYRDRETHETYEDLFVTGLRLLGCTVDRSTDMQIIVSKSTGMPIQVDRSTGMPITNEMYQWYLQEALAEDMDRRQQEIDARGSVELSKWATFFDTPDDKLAAGKAIADIIERGEFTGFYALKPRELRAIKGRLDDIWQRWLALDKKIHREANAFATFNLKNLTHDRLHAYNSFMIKLIEDLESTKFYQAKMFEDDIEPEITPDTIKDLTKIASTAVPPPQFIFKAMDLLYNALWVRTSILRHSDTQEFYLSYFQKGVEALGCPEHLRNINPVDTKTLRPAAYWFLAERLKLYIQFVEEKKAAKKDSKEIYPYLHLRPNVILKAAKALLKVLNGNFKAFDELMEDHLIALSSGTLGEIWKKSQALLTSLPPDPTLTQELNVYRLMRSARVANTLGTNRDLTLRQEKLNAVDALLEIIRQEEKEEKEKRQNMVQEHAPTPETKPEEPQAINLRRFTFNSQCLPIDYTTLCKEHKTALTEGSLLTLVKKWIKSKNPAAQVFLRDRLGIENQVLQDPITYNPIPGVA